MPRRTSVFLFALVASLWLGAAPALAHTEFSLSDPANESVLVSPLSEINVVFEGVAEPAGDGFLVIDAAGVVREPDTVSSADNLTWVLGFDEPLAEGILGVKWSVAAPDAHPIEGSFRFTLVAPDTVSDATPAIDESLATPEGLASVAEAAQASEDLDAFLVVEESGSGSSLGLLGRSISLAAAMLAIGGTLFAALVLRAEEQDIRSVVFWVRRAAVLLVLGAGVELVGHLVDGGSMLSSFGVAMGLRMVGGVLIVGVNLGVMKAADVRDPIAVAHGVASGAEGLSLTAPHDDDHAWHLDERFLGAVGGVAVLLMSYLFDGHTVTEGTRWITAIVDVVHVGAGAVWSGGLVMLVYVVWRRHLRGADARALTLAVRFSVVAAVALVTAGLAGSVLTVIILDSVSDLWSTSWGRFLMAKVAVVAAAGIAGGYNHKILIPKMTHAAVGDLAAEAEFRRTVTIEGSAMLLIVVATAFLVGAAS